MRQLLILFLVFSLWAVPAMAQNGDGLAYEVTDVAVDVTADSAAHARDQAVLAAQRTACAQLVERLNVDPGIVAKLSDDDIATLVQSFEVQSERASSVRYIGSFLVQFKPGAVRSWLGSLNLPFVDTRSPPVVILPVYASNGHPILWEESTRWRTAWEKAPHEDGLVPVIVPAGGLEDIAVLSTQEAIDGKTDAIKAFNDKYQAGGVVAATLNGSLDNLAAGFTLDLQHYDAQGNATTLEHLTLPVLTDKNAVDGMLAQAVKQARRQLDKDWAQDLNPVAARPDAPVPEAQAVPEIAANRLPVIVPIATLAEWSQIRTTLMAVPGVSRVNVIMLERDVANIEIEFHGNLQDLQNALVQKNMQLTQDVITGAWSLRKFQR